MADMVRKHTIEGTGNWRTICDIIDRTKEMLNVAKFTSRTFVTHPFEHDGSQANSQRVPPPTLHDQVPIGSSSASMYPGYSPADHEYGKAAEERGQFVAAARDQGIEITHPDAEYEIGQARGIKRKTLEKIRAAKKVPYDGPGSKGAGAALGTREAKPLTPHSRIVKPQKEKGEHTVNEAATNGDNQFFVIDVNPTPVNISSVTTKSSNRSATSPEPHAKKKSKEAKRKHDGVLSEVTEVANKSLNRNFTSSEPHEQEHKSKKGKQEHNGVRPGAVDGTVNSPKRSFNPSEHHEQEHKSKKTKQKHDGVLPGATDGTVKSPKRSATPSEHHEQEHISKEAKQKHDSVLPGATYGSVTSPKRSATPSESHEQGTKPKKAKKKHHGNLPERIEFEDISRDVDARMKEKEAKRKRKEEKKNKRDSEDLSAAQAESSGGVTAADNDMEVETPVKQKKKSTKSDDGALDRSLSKKRHGAEDDGGQGEGKKKRRRKSKEKVEA